QMVPRIYQRANASSHAIDEATLRSLNTWLTECDRSNSGMDRERARRTVLDRFPELLPLEPATFEKLLETVAVLECEQMEHALRECVNACRLRALTPEDVERAVANAGDVESPQSRFGGLVGQRLRKLNWMPSLGVLSDPTDANWRDAENVRVAKRQVRASMHDALKVLSLQRRTEYEARVVFGGSASPAFASRFNSSGAGSRGTKQIDNPNVRIDRSAQQAAADQRIKEFRDKRYEGMRPFDRWAAQGQSTVRALSAGIDQLFDNTTSHETEPSARSGKLNVQRFIQAKIQHEYARANSEDGDAGGVSLGAIFDAPVSIAQAAVKPKWLAVTLIDHSGSTEEDNRLGFFLGNAVVDIEAFERVKKVDVETALIGFAGTAQLLLPPRRRHTRDAKVAAIESLSAGGGTNDYAAAKELEDLIQAGNYDVVVVQWLTDGRGQDQTPALLREMTRKYPQLRLAGQGVSEDADYVRNLFPYSVVHDDPVMLGKAKYRFIKDEVLRGVR
ncbi:MAG: vWA domain-containing protein, partial [Myxococcota bacterium]